MSCLFFLERQLRIFRSMSGCLFRGSSIKLLVLIYRLILPQYSDVGDRTVYSSCTVYVLLKDFSQQVAHGLSNDNAPSTITQGMTGKAQGGALQVYTSTTFLAFYLKNFPFERNHCSKSNAAPAFCYGSSDEGICSCYVSECDLCQSAGQKDCS